jgi:addiction module RelB/DinJ family antitoxin
MKTAFIGFKTAPTTKIRAQQIAQDLGFNLSVLLNGFLNQLIKTRRIEFTAFPKEGPSDYLIESLKQAEQERKKGQIISFKKPKDALDYVDKLINK